MKLIVGLGNPGEKYEKTRHNLGFLVVDQFLRNFETAANSVWKENKKFKSDIAEIEWKPKIGNLDKVILAKPNTYMNNSGMAVSLISKFYKIDPLDIWVVHDELDLPLGYLKIRLGGSSAGHNGIESIIGSLGTEKFWRIRLGIGKEKTGERMAKYKVKNTEDYVLSSFSPQERGKIKNLVKHASRALVEVLEKGQETAMNKFNTR